MDDTLTLVIDIGKSHAKLLLVDASGAVMERHGRDNASVASPLDYPALDVQGLERWMAQTLRSSAHAKNCRRAIVSTHGAAFVGLNDTGLAWEPLDYEFAALDAHPELAQAFEAETDDFSCTGSPPLPMGLNAARQLAYVQALHPQAWEHTHCLLPYPQYWAWVLCGQRASEVSSLGCHTHLWSPQAGEFSNQARRRGWAALFAPLRHAWEVLGTVRAEVAQAWGLHPQCEVHVGVHDSNACLARYLDVDGAAQAQAALTVVSSGTWTVVMAPGASVKALQEQHDMLANVDVLGRATPTARFMGGRDYAHFLAGAKPEAGTPQDVAHLVQRGLLPLPAGTAPGDSGNGSACAVVLCQGAVVDGAALPDAGRATLGALYCALRTAALVQALWRGAALRSHRLVVEGPLSQNALYLGLLAALLPTVTCCASTDPMEGTAAGAWRLAQWGGGEVPAPQWCDVQALEIPGLELYSRQWNERAAPLC